MVSEELYSRLMQSAAGLRPDLVRWRRHLHANPELSFEEFATQAYVREALTDLGLTPQDIAGTGLISDLTPSGTSARAGCVAIRADLDALPITEVSGRPYGSTREGVMHACGHDVHTACALGAASILQSVREELGRPVRLIFQPGEELLPGGATQVIANGGLRNPNVEAIIALHVAPDLPVGTLGVRDGAYMASADELYLTLRGPGGHGALAHQSVDLVAVFAQLIVALQQVVSRKAPPDTPTVLSFGKVDTDGGATNILPARLSAAGTFRTYDEVWRRRAHQWIQEIAESTARMYGAEIELEIVVGYPALRNDQQVTSHLRSALKELLRHGAGEVGFRGSRPSGETEGGASRDRAVDKELGHRVGPERLVELALRPTAEDFAWYLQEVPGSFFRLGVANESRGITAGVHTADFDVDEDCLVIGALALAVGAMWLSHAGAE